MFRTGCRKRQAVSDTRIPVPIAYGSPSGIPYLLFSQVWFPTVQDVLQADWQDVWHSPQPPFFRVFCKDFVFRVLICFIMWPPFSSNCCELCGNPPDITAHRGIIAYLFSILKCFLRILTNRFLTTFLFPSWYAVPLSRILEA